MVYFDLYGAVTSSEADAYLSSSARGAGCRRCYIVLQRVLD